MHDKVLVSGFYSSPSIVKGVGGKGHVLVFGSYNDPRGARISCIVWKFGWPVAIKCI